MSADDLDLAVDLLDILADPDPCWFDHNGGCQAHGFLDLLPGDTCPNQQSRELVERYRQTH